MNLIICDDDEFYLKSIEAKINAWADGAGHRSDIMTYHFTSGEDMLDAWRHGLTADAFFLDIEIPREMNGLAVAREIHRTNEYIPIVFITNYGEYALEGYRVNALRYLHKPITPEAIGECMDCIWRRWSLQGQNCVLLNTSSQQLCLPSDSILYLEMKGHYCRLATTSNVASHYDFKLSLSQLREQLPPKLFAQCHRSCIVNLLYVRRIEKSSITMSDNTVLPIGRSYQRDFMEHFRQFHTEGGDVHAAANP